MSSNISFLELLIELPLAFLSFLFYKVMKFVIGNLYTVYLMVNKKQASRWRVLSAETLNSPLTLPVLMTKAPRWNTHAIIGTLGPFKVENSLQIDLKSMNQSAPSWIAVIYSFPQYETIASFESNRNIAEEEWATLSLNKGQYSIGLRYYNWGNSLTLPTVKVDDRVFVESQPIPPTVNEFYSQLIEQKNIFYLGLHYYIFTLLRLKKWLPDYFIKQEYLPVGATDTEFFYHYLLKNQSLSIEVDPVFVKNYDIYLTVYDRCSLPIKWQQITEEKYITNGIENKGYYLIRMRPKFNDLSTALTQFPIQFNLTTEDSNQQQLEIKSF